ncbi:MAG: DNA-protecting protein DprA [Bacteroidales bacterium]|nr:DNA-protecting protein DprA [Bacteroidales bacterium]
MLKATEDVYKIAISRIHGLGCISAKKLVAYTGSIESVFCDKASALRKVHGIGDYIIKQIISNREQAIEDAQQELLYISNNDINFVSFWDKDFPSMLRQNDDAPLIIYYKGKPEFEAKKKISIVGTRNNSRDSKEICENFVEQIAKYHPDAVVISGLAFGIDAAAHKAALKNNLKTWAVVGHGFNTIYPAEHTQFANEIVESGGVLMTEYHHDNRILPANFVERNRIVAGLSHAVVVVESSRKGGAMITADFANAYNRDVYAFPGKINRIGGNGCNLLIKSNKAHLIERIEDLEYISGWKRNDDSKAKEENLTLQLPISLTEEQKIITDILRKETYVDFDTLMQKSEFDTGKLSTILLELEFEGLIRSLPGKVFSLHKI